LRERLHVGCLIMHSVRDWRRRERSSSSRRGGKGRKEGGQPAGE
jgi:hypothetical protein